MIAIGRPNCDVVTPIGKEIPEESGVEGEHFIEDDGGFGGSANADVNFELRHSSVAKAFIDQANRSPHQVMSVHCFSRSAPRMSIPI
jgi:hypothetical protein